jgi:hypothetical protein
MTQTLNRILKFAHKVWLLINYVWVTIQLQGRRAKRLISRFFKRFIEIWYIGAFVLILLATLIFIGVRFQAFDSVKSYISGLVNIVITVYAIDFLRTEYERKKDANRRYLMDLELYQCSWSALKGIDYAFTGHQFKFTNPDGSLDEFKIISLSHDDIERKITEQHFWETHIKDGQTRREFLIEVLEDLKHELTHLTYTGFMSYEHYRLSSKALGYVDHLRLNETIRGVSSADPFKVSGFALSLMWLVEVLYELFHLMDYWEKDNDLIVKRSRLRQAYTSKT